MSSHVVHVTRVTIERHRHGDVMRWKQAPFMVTRCGESLAAQALRCLSLLAYVVSAKSPGSVVTRSSLRNHFREGSREGSRQGFREGPLNTIRK